MRMKIVLCLTAVLMLMLSAGPVTAADVSSADGTTVSSGNATSVTSVDSEATGDHTAALSVFMFAVAIVASPVTAFGAAYETMAVAWPAVIGGVAAGIQALK